MDKYTLEAGRAIRRNGRPFVSIHRSADPAGGFGAAPVEADTFARFIVAAIDALREAYTEPGSYCLDGKARPKSREARLYAINASVREALDLLPKREG